MAGTATPGLGSGTFAKTGSMNVARILPPRRGPATGNLNGARTGESMTVLQNGQALVAGGSQSTKNSNNFVVLATAELYNP